MSSQNGGGLHRSTSEVKKKGKPIRRDPEKRRQQNIQAQRRYREKLRNRLDQLETLAASAAQTCPIEGTPAAGTRPSGGVTRDSSSSAPSDISTRDLSVYDTSEVSVSSLWAITPEECQYPPQQWDSSLSALCTWDPRTYPQVDDSDSSLLVWSSTNYVDPSLLICDRENNSHGAYWTATVSCGCSTPHVQIRTQGPDPSCYGEIKVLSIGPGAPAADPYANHLRIETVCNISALYTLGTHVGITEELLCADDSLSPFFQFTVEPPDDTAKTDMVRAVQRIFKILKPDLRPTREQITVKHHPFIDIIPFPTLRRNLIKYQNEFNKGEFFHDMLTGLVCWGGAGVGKRDRNVSTGYASTGTPWDVRSWEARDWFVKKYWRLLGGEDGELVRQSEWWRSIRGDDSLNSEAVQITEVI